MSGDSVSSDSSAIETAAQETARAIRTGDRRAMARAITRLESTRDEDRAIGQAVLEALIAESGDAIRVGITGPPGVGGLEMAQEWGYKYALIRCPSDARGPGSG